MSLEQLQKMKNIVRLLFLLYSLLAYSCAGAQELKIIFSKYMPPYVFENETGIVVDIVRTALASSGHKIKPVYVPIGRGLKMFSDKQVDGTTLIQESPDLQTYYSDNFVHYHNRAFVLKSRNLDIQSVADLRGKSVIGFQYASKSLGEEYQKVVTLNPKYKELAQQEAQVQVLLLGRTDIVVMDEHVFQYYRQKLIAEGKVDKSQEYVGFKIFPPTPFKAAFHDPQIRDAFNKEVAAMRKDGRYEAIYRKYGQYNAVKK